MFFPVVVAAARTAGWLSRRLGRGAGSAVTGVVAIRLSGRSLEQLAAGRTVALVSGTNGKTTTTKLLASAVAIGNRVVSNTTGSNLESGLVTALMSDRSADVAVLEVDEVVLPRAIAATKPRLVVLLNLSRDQLDRTSEVGMHVSRWARALDDTAVVVANADDPLVVLAVRTARPDDAGVVWVGAGQPWRADTPLCPSCSHAWDVTVDPWCCDVCGARRPDPAWCIEGDVAVLPTGERLALELALPGRANRANTVVALAAAAVLGAPTREALGRLRTVSSVEGRYLLTTFGDHEVRLLLGKNPAGWAESLAELATNDDPIVIAINARAADGRDPSWLWDVPYEVLAGRRIAVTGDRRSDVVTRLHYGGVASAPFPTIEQALASLPAGRCTVAANYTAFVDIRAALTRGIRGDAHE